MRRSFASACLLLALLAVPAAASAGTRLLRDPDVSESEIVFAYGSDLWVAPRAGGEARRLTGHPGIESDPAFSPDGRFIAFTGIYDGNYDVYVVPSAGGEPQRLTWHPGPDEVRGWSPDGSKVVFASGRTGGPYPIAKLWAVPREGGFPEALPMPRAARGQYSPDGQRFAYEPIQRWESEWRGYRGGQVRPIWLLDLDGYALRTSPWDGSNDHTPVFLGDAVYFLSDRDGVFNVHKWAPGSERVEQLTHFRDFDARDLESGGGALVFEQGGFIHLLEPGGEPRRVDIEVRGDFPWARPHWEDAAKLIADASLSPTGARALFEARGEIFTVPAEKGDVRNLSADSGAADRSPAWSPDGKSVAWFSDRGGEYQVVIAEQSGANRRSIRLENPTFYYTPAWSPDSKWIAYADADRVLWALEVATGKVRRIDEEGFAHPERTIYPEWSPDSKWIAYTKRLANQFNAIRVYSLEQDRSFPITDGLSDCVSPAWDKGGKLLYFLGSTDYSLSVGWLDMSSLDHQVTRSVYVAVLPAGEPSPLAPQSDEEKGEESKDEGKGKDAKGEKAGKSKGKEKAGEGKEEEEEKPPEVKIDLDGLPHRILSLALPPRPYHHLRAGEPGVLFVAEAVRNQPGSTLHRYAFEKREAKVFLPAVNAFALSADGKKILYQAGEDWTIAETAGEPKPGEGKLKLADLRLKVDPPAEWRQIFREAWRFQRDYFYVDNVHGLDLDAVFRKYEPWLAEVRHRADLTFVLDVLGGETSVGHSFTGGGDEPDVDRVPVGLLGADLEIADGRYRFARIYDGESWNPDLRAPLRGPGVDVKAGDYLLAVNGVELRARTNPYSLFDRTADRQTVLRIGAKPTLEGSREVTVVPVASEDDLRGRAWVEDNRRKVDELSGGRLAYVWLPNTGEEGFAYFNRYYFAQQDKKGAILDERFNRGGYVADYFIDVLARTLMGYFNNPIGARQPFTVPNGGIWGPKVMIVNESAGSGGDMLPYMFRLKRLGPIVGMRTWGGLVGIWDVPPLVDGGYITAPRGGYFNLAGEWDVENKGVPPDIEVEQTPAEVIAGHDPQLEKAVSIALELLKAGEVHLKPQPPDPVRVVKP